MSNSDNDEMPVLEVSYGQTNTQPKMIANFGENDTRLIAILRLLHPTVTPKEHIDTINALLMHDNKYNESKTDFLASEEKRSEIFRSKKRMEQEARDGAAFCLAMHEWNGAGLHPIHRQFYEKLNGQRQTTYDELDEINTIDLYYIIIRRFAIDVGSKLIGFGICEGTLMEMLSDYYYLRYSPIAICFRL